MKKFISLALAAAMTLSLVPVSAFAATENRVTNVVTVQKDDVLETAVTNVPSIVIKDNRGDILKELSVKDSGDTNYVGSVVFELQLDGAEWDGDTLDAADITGLDASTIKGIKFEKLGSTKALITIEAKGDTTQPAYDAGNTDEEISIKLNNVKVTGDVAKLTINPRNSSVSSDTFTIAKAVDGETITTIDGKKDFTDYTTIKPIFVEEVTAGSLGNSGKITLKLNSGFKFKYDKSTVGTNFDPELVAGDNISAAINTTESDERTLVFDVKGSAKSTTAAILKFDSLVVAEDGAKEGSVAEITVSGTNVTKTSFEVGTYVNYSVDVSTEDKDLPVIYSGVAVDDDNNETLKLTVKENVVDSWFLDSRKTTFTFPEGVKVQAVNVDSDTDKIQNETSLEANNFEIDGNEVTFSGAKKTDATKDKAKLVVTFDVVTAPDFTGDITCTVGGSAVSEDSTVTLAKAVAPITVEADKTSVAIDYRNVNVGDITIKEAEAGLWGKDEKITLKVDNMQFESGIKAEVVEGDGEIKKLDISKNNGTITITVDSESSKTPMNIKLSNVSLYLDRALPAGDYSLSLVATDYTGARDIIADDPTDVMFQTYNKKDGNEPSTASEFGFDVDEVEVLKDYVTVATAGRDQGTSFTTEVKVTIDSTKMIVDGVEKDLSQGTATSTAPVPAPYLTADGYTMVPVRAVTEALASSANKEPVSWVNGTVLISYGDRTVSMTIGSTTMYINGTPVPMNTAPVIVDGYTFIPYRDLGNALGLTSEQIAWDAATRTATFNPATTATK